MKKKILCIIPARGGSKSIPLKNIYPLCQKPLIQYSILQAKACSLIDRVVVSTDDEKISAISKTAGAEVLFRPSGISGDLASSESAILHSLDTIKQIAGVDPDLVVFIQCTSPVRRDNDLEKAIELMEKENADSLLSVVRFHTFLWKKDPKGEPVAIDYDYRNRPRRQDRGEEFIENGSFYIFKPHVFRVCQNRLGGKIALFEMDQFSLVDINEQNDIAFCESIILFLRSRDEYKKSLCI